MDDIREINSQSQQALAHGDTIKVAKLDGHATVRHADGSVSALKVGMILKMGDVVITSPGARASIQVAEGESIPCGDEKGDVLAIDKTVLDFFSDAQDFQPTDSNTIKDALNDLNKVINPEDLNNLEATAAGFDPGALIIQNSTPNPVSFQGFNYHNPFLPWSTQFNNGAAPATPIFLNTSRVANFINTIGENTSAREDWDYYKNFKDNTHPYSVRGFVQVVDANAGESTFDTLETQYGTYGNFVFEVNPTDSSKGSWTYYLAEPGQDRNEGGFVTKDRFGETIDGFPGNTSGDTYQEETFITDIEGYDDNIWSS